MFGLDLLPIHTSVLPTYKLAHQVCICRQKESDTICPGNNKQLEEMRIFFQICTYCNVGKCTVDGYGSLTIPVKESRKNVYEVRTSKLKWSRNLWVTTMYRIIDFYFGCSIGDLRTVKHNFLEYQGDCKRHHAIKSEISGIVRINSQVKKHLNRKTNYAVDSNMKVKNTIDKVLSKVRRQRRAIKQSLDDSNFSKWNEGTMSGTTKDLLSRLMQRKEVRTKQLLLEN